MKALLSFCLALFLMCCPLLGYAGKYKLPEGTEVVLQGSRYVALTLEEYREIGLVYNEANRLVELEKEYTLKLKSYDDTEDVWYQRLTLCEDSLVLLNGHNDYLMVSLDGERELRSKDKKLRVAERILGTSVIVLLLGLNVYQGVKLADQ